jgi:hypothetical protein
MDGDVHEAPASQQGRQFGFVKQTVPGELMAHVCEIKEVGMDSVFDPLREARGGRFRLQPKRPRSFDFE